MSIETLYLVSGLSAIIAFMYIGNFVSTKSYRVTECHYYNERRDSYEVNKTNSIGSITIDLVSIKFNTGCLEKTYRVLNESKLNCGRTILTLDEENAIFIFNEENGELSSRGKYRITFKMQRK